MTRMIWCAAISLLLSSTAKSQVRSNEKAKRASHSKTVSVNKAKVNSSNTVKLSTTASYPAKANIIPMSTLKNNNYTVSDPILTTLNARANGANVRFNNSGIIGMPKSAYGFANGHITLHTTGAVTSGTQTGSGGVGTGTSPGTFGSIGAPMNVNGKSPYAGINMWGNAMNMNITGRDSSVRLFPLKKH